MLRRVPMLDQTLRPNPMVAWLQQAQTRKHWCRYAARTRWVCSRQRPRSAAPMRRSQRAPEFSSFCHRASVPLAHNVACQCHRFGGRAAMSRSSHRRCRRVCDVGGRPACSGAVRQTHHNGLIRSIGKAMTATEAQAIIAGLNLAADAPAAAAYAALRAMPRSDPSVLHFHGFENQIHACGRANFTRAEIEAVICAAGLAASAHGGGASHQLTAMTVQQAKNREFEGVVVLWPYQVGGDAEHSVACSTTRSPGRSDGAMSSSEPRYSRCRPVRVNPRSNVPAERSDRRDDPCLTLAI